jgi:hypothetical protein
MKTRKRWHAVAMTVVVTTATIFPSGRLAAQGPMPPQGMGQGSRASGDSPNDPSYLLDSEPVQNELGLSDNQKAALQKVRDEQSTGDQSFFAGFMGISPDEMQRRLERRASDLRNKIQKVLTPQQTARLSEINLQIVGIVALSYDDVAKALGLSAEQRQQLKSVSDESHQKLDRLVATVRISQLNTQQRADLRKKQEAIAVERKEKSLALLTDEQKSKFEKLKGEKFDTSSIKSGGKSVGDSGKRNAPAGPLN